MPQLQSIIRYLKNCYQADNRESGLLDFYSDKLEHKWLLTEASVFTGDLPIYPVDPEWGAAVEKTLSIYQKEKELKVAYVFITGEFTINNNTSKVVTPLFLLPTELEKRGEDYFFKPISEMASVNPLALTLLASLENNSLDILEELYRWVKKGTYLFADMGSLRKLLVQAFPKLATDELLMYPTLFDKKAIKEIQNKTGFHVLPAAGIGVLRRSSTTLGILSELEQLLHTEDYSLGLKAFFGGCNPGDPVQQKLPLIPAVLSNAQLRVFDAVANNQLVQITGPPGTGKSFLIAALAVDCMSKGNSVLIVSANDQAVDVIHQKIDSDFQLEQIAVRGGAKRDYKDMLKKRLENWLNGIGVEKIDQDNIKTLKQEVKALQNQLALLEGQYRKKEKEALRDGKFLSNYQGSWIQAIQRYFLYWRVQRTPPLWKIFSLYQKILFAKHEKIKELLHQTFYDQLYQTLRNHRRELRQLLSAIRARTSSKKESVFHQVNFDLIKKTLPVWLVTVTEVSHILPLKKELFDIVIIDEATQCDIVSILPVLQRGKKVIVAGDPKQLQHVCFLSNGRQQQIAENCGLTSDVVEQYNYRDHSLLNIVNRHLASQDALIFLDEHYRSQPSIIQFSNEYFYHSQLRVMTTQPQNESVQHVRLVRVPGIKNEWNEQEADYILQKIKAITEEEAHLPASVCQSIGVLSPFRQQVAYIQKKVYQMIGTDVLLKHQLLVGTPYSFQGEERDIMFISLAVDHNSHPSTFRHLSREDVFNVSITRARSEQWIVTSLYKPTGYSAASLLERYLASIEQDTILLPQKHKITYKDEFLKSVVDWLKMQGIQDIHQQYSIAGLEIDLVIVRQEKTYCIDLVGYPGAMEEAFSIERCKILHRIGIYLLPLPYSRWQLESEQSKRVLIDFLCPV